MSEAEAGEISGEGSVSEAEAGEISGEGSVSEAEAGEISGEGSVSEAEAGEISGEGSVSEAEAGEISEKEAPPTQAVSILRRTPTRLRRRAAQGREQPLQNARSRLLPRLD